MKPDFKNLFIKIEIEVPADLRFFVIKRIESYQRLAARRKAIFEGVVSVLSFAGIVSVFNMIVQSFVQSGFYQYIQLVLSGDVPLSSYWRELGLSLVESLPVFSTVLLLGGVVLFLWTGAQAMKNVRAYRTPSIV